MSAAPQWTAGEVNRYVDQRAFLHGIGWAELKALVAMRGDAAGPRLTYLDGELELMSPSESHEVLKTTLGRLLEAWADRAGVGIEGYGSWTLLTTPTKKGAAEPDECYFVGERAGRKVPDLAIEVVWTHGGLDKLEVYRRLGVPEVWVYDSGKLGAHVLTRRGYEAREKSHVLPRVDLRLLERCLKEPSQTKAVKKLRAALRGRRLDA